MHERQFPILTNYRDRKKWPEIPQTVPWSFIEPARAQAQKNHSQTLERLAERGGLCPGEIRCAVEGIGLFGGRKWDERAAKEDAEWLIERLARHQLTTS